MILVKTEKVNKKKAKKWAKILGKCPGVQAIFLSGSLPQGNATKDSDIDFFIIARHGRIWTARFFVFLILKLFRQIATDSDHAGKICPNHFISDQYLEIRERDAFAARLFTHNIPLYDPEGMWGEFLRVNAGWVREFGERFQFVPKTTPKCHTVETRHGMSSCKEGKTNWFESFLKKIQIKKIKKNPEFKLPGAKIVLEDYELRFHPRPKNRLRI